MKFIAVYQILLCKFEVEKFIFDMQLLAHALAITLTHENAIKLIAFSWWNFFSVSAQHLICVHEQTGCLKCEKNK